MFPRDEPTLTQDRRALERVVKLPHVARPLVAHQHLQRVWRQTRRRTARRSVQFQQEGVDQQGDVATALAQGWHADIEDLQPIKQILPKASVRDSLLQITVARSN